MPMMSILLVSPVWWIFVLTLAQATMKNATLQNVNQNASTVVYLIEVRLLGRGVTRRDTRRLTGWGQAQCV